MKLGFGKTKQKDASPGANPDSLASTKLKELTGGDGDLYGALSHLMFLDPKKITMPLEAVLKEAQDYEAQGNKLRAEVGFRIAGGISLYKGDEEGMNRYFSKAASYAGNSHPEYQIILKRASEAMAIARKYYEEFGSASVQL